MVIVVGVDESPVAKTVLERALDVATRRGAEVHVVHVLQPSMVYGEFPVDLNQLAEAQRRSVWEPLEETIANAEVSVETVDLSGYPPDVLVEFATQQDADLLVLGTRGRGSFTSLILGSTSQRAIHLADCDVLVVKTHKTAKE